MNSDPRCARAVSRSKFYIDSKVLFSNRVLVNKFFAPEEKVGVFMDDLKRPSHLDVRMSSYSKLAEWVLKEPWDAAAKTLYHESQSQLNPNQRTVK